jgi:hypothetical protein
MKGEIKSVPGKQKLKEFMTNKLPLQKILKGILQTEEQEKCNHENMGKT